ncbi:MAG: hypothetical protein ACI85O_003757 [Saprospiraceae bacterium]|jgi:hypothetical protein
MKEVNKNRNDEILSHHTDVNIDEIWAVIEPQVDLINAEKKRKKRFLFFFLLGAILLASSGLYLWQSDNDDVETNDTNHTIIDNTKIIENGEYLSEEGINVKTEKQNTDNQILETLDNKTEDKKIQSKITASTSTKSAIASDENVLENSASIVYSKMVKTRKTLLDANNGREQINTNNPLPTEEKIASTKLNNPKENSNRAPLEISPKVSTRDTKFPTFIPDVGELDIAEEAEDEDQLPGGKLNFALSGNTGISFINRGLRSNIPEDFSPEVLRLRRESETLLEAIYYGLRGKLTHRSGFSLSTGAQYTVLSERYDNNNITMESDSIEGIIKRVIQFNGDTIDIVGLIPRATTYDYEKEIYNRYKMIDIPFIVGFEGGMNEWSIGIQAGVFVNLALKTSGQIRSTLSQDLDIGDNQTDIFKSKVGLSYYGGIYIRRALSSNLDITIAPHGRFFAKDFNVSSYALNQRYSLIGVQAGLSYRFGY